MLSATSRPVVAYLAPDAKRKPPGSVTSTVGGGSGVVAIKPIIRYAPKICNLDIMGKVAILTSKPQRTSNTWYTLINERPHEGPARPPRSIPHTGQLVRPANPATYATLRMQQRTGRSFETTSPPDVLASWLLDHNWKPLPKSASQHEYARLGLGRTPEGKPAALVILFWSGSVLCQGVNSDEAARTLAALCEPSPEQAGMFDGLEGGEA